MPGFVRHECSVFKQQIQSAIEEGRIKFDDQKKSMKIDGHPFPVCMIGGGSSALIDKYQKKRKREERIDQERRFYPHWECPFFVYCWDQGMRLPSVDNCPRCSNRPEGLFRKGPETSRSAQRRETYARHQADREARKRRND